VGSLIGIPCHLVRCPGLKGIILNQIGAKLRLERFSDQDTGGVKVEDDGLLGGIRTGLDVAVQRSVNACTLVDSVETLPITILPIAPSQLRRWYNSTHSVCPIGRVGAIRMIIRCWGTRGSTPVSGEEHIKYGGNTTCLELRTSDDEMIIIDAGTGIIKLGNALMDQGLHKFSILFTHSHWDHVLGFPFFKPAYFRDTQIDMFGCPFVQETVKRIVSGTMNPPYFPVDFEDISCEISYHGACENSFSIGSAHITPIKLSHPDGGIGYKIVEDNKSFVFLTDNELTYKHPTGLDYQSYVDFSRNSDLLFHDADYTPEEYQARRAWGHSVYSDALRLALDAEVNRFGLVHHNYERPDAEIDSMVDHCHKIIEDEGATLECFAVSEGMEMVL
jgi:phosphoribosyl 1,2-cyclic phosphodiesterase